MPKLILFAPCERVIIEAGSNALSMISLLQTVHATVQRDTPVEKAATGPIRWHVLVIWQRLPGDEAKVFTQKVSLFDPAGDLRMDALADIDLKKEFLRSVGSMAAFPIGMEGEYTLAVSIKENGGEWTQLATYPITVSYQSA
jgi:hypothetical protein